MLPGAVVVFAGLALLPVGGRGVVVDTVRPVLTEGDAVASGRPAAGVAWASPAAARFAPVAVPGLAEGATRSVSVPADTPVVADTPVARPRPRAIEYSDAYNTRLAIHRYASFALIPGFAVEYWLGQKLISRTTPAATWVKPTHRAVAYAVTGIFGLNTVTGLWNLWDSRKDPNGRTRRWVHTLTMLASDAGFVAADATAHHAAFSYNREVRHRNIALASIGLSTASAVYMWLTR